ncbi:unnamed protein product [Lupinus luteus]|uniref:Myb-like domain-containing protein n=1 Tax=Lupinus luteus TaxID=3873 RepID=A0AAV1VTV8_LUPLU
MALEQQQLSLDHNPNPVDGEPDGTTNGGDDGGKAPRLPRWTRQEIVVLIQGKRDAENKFRRGRTAGLSFGSGQVEPKWGLVSSYCAKHGVNRGPVQCRKRWSNLAGDYKKIKEWESQIKDETESYWVMRNDLRRERKLPGFFDKEVFDILDSGSPVTALSPALVLALSSPEGYSEPPQTHVYDSNRSVGGLFSDFEHDEVGGSPSSEKKDVPVATPIPEKQYQPIFHGSHGEGNAQGVTNGKQPASNPEAGSTSQGERKRKHSASDAEEETLQYQLIDVLERNGKMLNTQLEAQNINFQLDCQQRKDHSNNLIAVLDKLANALGRIADKL